MPKQKSILQSKPSNLFTVLSLVIALVILPVTVLVVQKNTDNRSKASNQPIEQGVYESCLISDQSCVDRLTRMAASGVKVVINYDQPYASMAQHLAYADKAKSLQMKIIWNIKDTEWWDTNSTNAVKAYSDLVKSCTDEGKTCATDTELVTYFINSLKSHDATWGYYVGDETTASNHATVKKFTDLVKQLDPNHPRLFISAEDCATNGKNLDTFTDTADVIGSDWYPWPRTDCPMQSTTVAIASHIKQLATSQGKQTAYVAQAFSWAQYNESWVCTPFPSCAIFPSASQMIQEKNTVLSVMQPRLLLWYSFFDIWNTDQYSKIPGTKKSQQAYWDDVTTAINDGSSAGTLPTTAPTTIPTNVPKVTLGVTSLPSPTSRIYPSPTSLPQVTTAVSGDKLGYTGIGHSTDSQVGQQISAIRVSLGATKYANGIAVYVKRIPTSGTQIAGAIYTDVNGKPGKLLWGGQGLQINSTGWQTIAVPHVSLAPGNYWIAFNANKFNTAIVFSDTTRPIYPSYQTWVGNLSWPSTAPSSPVNQWSYSMYLIASNQ